jgi:hypothetical protein
MLPIMSWLGGPTHEQQAPARLEGFVVALFIHNWCLTAIMQQQQQFLLCRKVLATLHTEPLTFSQHLLQLQHAVK